MHGLGDVRAHRFHLFAARRAVIDAHRRVTHGDMAYQLGDVEAKCGHALEKLGEAAPLPVQAAVEKGDEIGKAVCYRLGNRRW